ncbi:Integral membrane protein [Halanaerobium saccharolyticum subsp. saccharolyticum DSM 6643]|uniref:Integral membrane protein n=1 Tax=Halanaerobium saccharolyticum subsp. saccharolyticum DSM 6643 TaxID=1293054 RepID=M5DYQ4_9FIRM|nr:SMR family transporter [Halanaerobium saccharolyticum]CCU78723.1 Integral membrane protein [Halanaerobium saccharolyticum subsp. saccharolyticum DSM 6643]
MIYLFLAVLCSSSIALIFKFSESNNLNRYLVTSINYFTAAAISLFLIFNQGIKFFDFNHSDFRANFNRVIFEGEGLFSAQSSQQWATLIGLAAGIFFFTSFIYYQKSVRENGASLAGTFGKLGILIPMLFAIIIWREYPEDLQWVGILLAISSIILVNFPFKKDLGQALRLNLIFLFLYGGIAEFSNKIFQKYALVNYKVLFLFWVFFSAFLISSFYSFKKVGRYPKKSELLTGFAVGIPNLFSSFFLISALNYLKTAVVFPIFSAGSIVLITAAGCLFFGEKLKTKEWLSILMTVVALILINI